MPVYVVTCGGCGYAGDCYARVADLRGDGGMACPECGGHAEQDWGAKRVAARGAELHGKRQLCTEVKAHPSEVPRLRRMFGANGGACWGDDGRVTFRSREEARRFYTRENEIVERAKERNATQDATGNAAPRKAKRRVRKP